jgi:hypothetical protein
MNDDFLGALREPPRPDFAADLYRRISQQSRARRTMMNRVQRVAGKRIGVGLAVMSLVTAVLLIVSPAARAQVDGLLQRIGNFSFVEVRDPRGEPIPWETQRTNLDDAQAKMPFTFAVPRWAPEQFTLDNVEVLQGAGQKPGVAMDWHKGKQAIHFLAVQGPRETTSQVVPGSVEAIEINGQPAALLRGHHDPVTGAWDRNAPFYWMTWDEDGVTYVLGNDNDSPEVTLDDLLQMAASMR